MKYLLPFLLLGFIFTNCAKDLEIPILSPAEQLSKDISEIKAYLTTNNLTAQETSSGLHYIVEEKGGGNFIDRNSRINVLLTGYFLSGDVFDKTDECVPITLNVLDLIDGWQEAITFFNVGGKGSLYLPSALAFGQSGNSAIPANKVIAFDFEVVDQKPFEKGKIKSYLVENKIRADSTFSGIYYTIDEPGKGENPTSASQVTVNYKGYFLNGTVFDSPVAPTTFDLSGVIAGWQEVIPLLKAGGKGTFIIPSERGYGTTGLGSIPGNSTLIFDIELIEFK